ncbi:MAG: hypothetical protein EZS28_005377, partial [Streblomastix strix]
SKYKALSGITKNYVARTLSSRGIKKAAGWVVPTLNKVLGTLAGPVSTLHPDVGAVMGIGSRLAGGVSNYLNKDQ